MADQNITALPVSTTPETSDQLLLVGATEEKLIDYDKLADAILNKLTSKKFSLDQGTMPLISALNQLNSKALMHNRMYSANYDTLNSETIEIDLGGITNSAEILLMDKFRMIFVHAYSADGKTIGEIVTKTIYGDNVTPATNNTIISIYVGSWNSGSVIMSYTQKLPSFSLK